jgi:VIT1/CCC1 family predicted Fe2+/Mn2+ transporter
VGAEYGLSGVRASVSGPAVHLSHRSNWLRAAVLGANDGIVSTASLVLGVAASRPVTTREGRA